MAPIHQRPGDRYVHQPDGHSETGEEVYCFLDFDRVCTAECVAFDVAGVGAETRSTCMLVNSAKQVAAALAVIGRSQRGVSGSDAPIPKVGM
jgi:hypothetical protein